MTEDNPVLVLPFAQSQVVRAFMEGIDPELEHYLTMFRDELFAGAPDAIAKSLSFKGAATRERITSELTSAVASVSMNLKGFLEHMRFAHYAQPVVETITHMPRDELARVAETLVSLTSFRQRVTISDETVGGPIDVAVISKGDGFIWIKRKHDFEAELNQRYIAHLYERDMTNGPSQDQGGKEQKSEDRDEFISVTEVEERFFPRSRSRRTEERVPLEVETYRRVRDALSDISSSG